MRTTEDRLRDEIRHALKALVREHHGCGVRGADWRLGEDWAGDPAVFVWLVVDEDAWRACSREERLRVWEDVQAVLGEVCEAEVYVRIRSVSDEPAYPEMEHIA